MAQTVDRCSGRRFVLGAVLLFCGLVLGMSAPAQAQDGTIFGQVTDESGAVLPGVTVTVSGPALLVKEIVEVTGVNGEYRVTPLPLGTYTVEYSLAGFQTVRREGVRLTAGFVAKLDEIMKVGALAETVTVSGQSPVVDVKTTGAGTQLTREVLESVPNGRNGLISVMTMAAGARTQVDFGTLGAIEPYFKAFGRQNKAWVLVEGVATVPPTGGGTGVSQQFDYDSIEESRVQTLGAPAESPTSGIQAGIIFKSGGNDFHGGAGISTFGSWMQSNNIDDELKAQGITVPQGVNDRWDRNAEIGGRILRDRLWFYTSGRARHEATVVVGAFKPDGSPTELETDHRGWLLKLTGQLSQSQKLIFANNWFQRASLGGNSTTRFQDYSTIGYHIFNIFVRKLEYQWVKGNKLLSAQTGQWYSTPPDYFPCLSPNVNTLDSVTQRETGCEDPISGGGIRVWRGRYDQRATLNWYKSDFFLGDHDFKTGFNYARSHQDTANIDRNTVEIDERACSVDSSCGPNQVGNMRLLFQSGIPNQMQAFNNPDSPLSKLDYTAAFWQDSWTLNRRLTLNIGIRYAHDMGSVPQQCRVTSPPPFQDLFPAACFPEVRFGTWNTVVPRVHAAYDVTGDGKTVIKGGWARFYDMRDNADLNLANNNAQQSATFTWHDNNGDKLWQPGESNLSTSTSNPDFRSQTGSPNPLLVSNPDLRPAGSDELSVSLERELMRNLAVRVSGIYSHYFNTRRTLNLARPYSVYNIPITNADPGPDNILNTADDPGTFITYFDYPAAYRGAAFEQQQFVNDSTVDSNYKSLEIAASKRLSNRWQMMASFSATRSHIPFAENNTTVTAVNPNSEINTTNDVWDWLTRFSGSYQLPWEIQTSANYEIRSGEPWARQAVFRGGQQITSITLNVEPFGARRTPVVNFVTFRAEKSFRLKGSHRLSLQGQIINLTNTNEVATFGTGQALAVTRVSGPSFGKATAVAPPRLGEINVIYRF